MVQNTWVYMTTRGHRLFWLTKFRVITFVHKKLRKNKNSSKVYCYTWQKFHHRDSCVTSMQNSVSDQKSVICYICSFKLKAGCPLLEVHGPLSFWFCGWKRVEHDVPKRARHSKAEIVHLRFEVMVGMVFLHLVEAARKWRAEMQKVVSEVIQYVASE